ncbi:hypothetical protein Micbo1qcDRAFT_207448 [Microdochium bolleyi]|uniref:Zn(2)-C6 fungal-type domain-containing protein n=1 Tax=Microdochium bolleyi TaxID=196109 RepID=A0A136IT46_9PEZI|nr:hypothetical protein Micbo1qcDRAFT_207448 [Microdochium bolleyi]
MGGGVAPPRLRPLLPAQPPQSEAPGRATDTAPGPRGSHGACEGCRRRKAKCDGARPACRGCVRRKLPCHYGGYEGETPRQALKRKYGELQSLDSDYACVFAALRDRPEAEATTIFRRLRQAGDVRSLARHIEQGDLLLQMTLAPVMDMHYHQYPLCSPTPASPLPPRDNRYLDSFGHDWIRRPASAQAVMSANGAVRGPCLKPYHTA